MFFRSRLFQLTEAMKGKLIVEQVDLFAVLDDADQELASTGASREMRLGVP